MKEEMLLKRKIKKNKKIILKIKIYNFLQKLILELNKKMKIS